MYNEIIKELTEKITNIKLHSFEEYFPQMIEDFLYIEIDLPEKLNSLTTLELIDYNYQIQELVMTYLMEVIRRYTKEILKIEINYQFDELLALGGYAAYNDKEEKILISVMAIMMDAINTISYIQPVLHEFRHKIQHDYYQETDMNNMLMYPSYFFLIELHSIISHPRENQDFYLDNYTHLYPEIDAEDYSSHIVEDIIPSLYRKYQMKSDNNIYLQERVNLLEQIINLESSEIRDLLKQKKRIQTKYSQELYGMIPIHSIFSVDNKKQSSLLFIQQYIEEHSEVKQLHPHLLLLWNDNEVKDYQQLMVEKELLLEMIPDKTITLIGDNQTTTTHQQIEKLYSLLFRISEVLSIKKVKRKSK